jgi:AmmeMemoRadiSam system protein A
MDSVLTKEQQNSLLTLARKSIEHYLKAGKTLKEKTEDAILKGKRGAFVTLKVNNELRGCIGYPLPVQPLHETIIDAAVSAASKDYRFQSISLKDLSEMKIEISVLSLPREVKDVKDIEVGKHGIIITKGAAKGLLLPQVAVEWNWDRVTFLRHSCMKAGLEEDAWEKGAKIEIFSAQVFSED